MMNADLFRLVYSLLMAVGQQPVKEGVSEYYMQSSGSSSAQQRFMDFVSKRSDPMWFQQDMQDSRESRAYIADENSFQGPAIMDSSSERQLQQEQPFPTDSSTVSKRDSPDSAQRTGGAVDYSLVDRILQDLSKGLIGRRLIPTLTGIGKDPSLPQSELIIRRGERRLRCKKAQLRYRYDYDTNFKGCPMLKSDPLTRSLIIEELPTLEWIKMIVTQVLKIRKDIGAADIKAILEGRENIFQVLNKLIARTFKQRPSSIDDYKTLIFDKDMIPSATKDYMLDEAFARWRLAGVNSMHIEPATAELVEKKLNMRSIPERWQRRIRKAFNDKRLFVCDYTILGMWPGSQNIDAITRKVYQKYTFGPITVFEIPEEPAKRRRQWLEPLAIQIDRIDPNKPESEQPPMYTPDDGMHWNISKAVAQSADANYHGAVIHLGSAHMAIEPFMIATNRQLAKEHPLYVLLKPHFAGTANVNFGAERFVFMPDGPLEHMDSVRILTLLEYAARNANEKQSRNFTFPATIEQRKMDEGNFPAPYPYRDDGMVLWYPIRRWVEEYLQLYYGDSDRVQRERIRNDYELQAWIKELSLEGRVAWFGQFDGSFQTLVDYVASIVYTATAYHVTVHYPQTDVSAYVPAYPSALYKPPPGKGEPATMEYLLDMYPPLEMAAEQRLRTTNGAFYYGQLGEYGRNYFHDKRVADGPLKRFKEALIRVQERLEQRNRERVRAWKGYLDDDVAQNWSYEYLYPKNIPTSINV